MRVWTAIRSISVREFGTTFKEVFTADCLICLISNDEPEPGPPPIAPCLDKSGEVADPTSWSGLLGPRVDLALDSCTDQNQLLHANADALLKILHKVLAVEVELDALETDSRSLDQTLTALEEVVANGSGTACRLVGSATIALDWQDGAIAAGAVSHVIYQVVDTSYFAFAVAGRFVPLYIASLQYPVSSLNSIGPFVMSESQILGASTSSFRFVVAVNPNLFSNPADPTASYSLRWTSFTSTRARELLRHRFGPTIFPGTFVPTFASERFRFHVLGRAQAVANNWHVNWIGNEAADGTDYFRGTPHSAGTSMAWTDGSSDGIVAQTLSSATAVDWFRVYQNFVIVSTLSGRDKVGESIGWSTLSANPDGTFVSRVHPTSPWPILTAVEQPVVSAASAGWRLDWIAVPI